MQEAEQAEFETKRQEWEQQAEAKTAKNRAKRQKKKERAKGKGPDHDANGRLESSGVGTSGAPLKKRRLVNGQELVFRRPGEESDEDEDEAVGPQPNVSQSNNPAPEQPSAVPVVEAQRIVIHEED